MRWLVVGSGGMLGRDLVPLLRERGHEVTASTRDTLDVTDATQVGEHVAGHDVVVNCAAYTAVDAAETDEAAAFDVNAVGPARLAAAASAAGARLVQVSTDYVFDGRATSPYAEDAPVAPRSAYGRTKVAGEWAVRAGCADHLVVRTAWLYGAHGGCLPRTVARVVGARGGIDVVDDQVGQPTWTVDVADLVERLVVVAAPAGTYHATAAGSTSWFGFAQDVVEASGGDRASVRPTSSDQFVRPAPRPGYSVLGHDALTGLGVEPIGDWAARWALAAPVVLAG